MPNLPECGRFRIAYRLALDSDEPALAAARAAFWADQISKGSLDYPDVEPNKLLADTRVLLKRARTSLILAADGIKIAAYALGQTKIVPGTRSAVVSSIEEIYVDPLYRRSAVAQQLVKMMIVEFTNLGATRLQLRVLDGNSSAKAFWREIGFSPSVVIYEYSK